MKELPVTSLFEAREKLATHGAVLLRGAIPKEKVAKARALVQQKLVVQGLADDRLTRLAAADGDQGMLKGAEDIIRHPDFLAAVECDELKAVFEEIFQEGCRTFDFKWLRAVPPGDSSGFHMDSVYMAGGSSKLLTCWIPFLDVPLDLGGLAVMPGTHASEDFAQMRATYGQLDMDRDSVGGTLWFTEDPDELLRMGSGFATAKYEVGDVVVFTLRTVHGSAVNCTQQWRISCDVRFQPASEPIDQRWIRDEDGKIPGETSRWVLHRNDPKEYPKTMEMAKQDWGFAADAPVVEPANADAGEPASKIARTEKA